MTGTHYPSTSTSSSSSTSNLLPSNLNANNSLGHGAITPSPLATQFPHLSHYIASLLQIAQQENAQAQRTKVAKHPLSVSSASSDVHDNDNDNEDEAEDGHAEKTQGRSRESTSSSSPPSVDISGSEGEGEEHEREPSAQREELIRKVVDLLGNEKEEEVKAVVKERLGVLGNDESYIDQVCLDLMHKHKDDVDSVPYTPFSVTPIRPKASPIPAHAQPFRPFTPSRAPSYRARTPLGRPQSPAAGLGAASSVLGAAGYGSAGFNSAVSPMASPASSPQLSHRTLNFGHSNQASGTFSPGGSLMGHNNGASGGLHGLNINTMSAPGSGAVTPTGTGPKLGMHLPAPFNAGGPDPAMNRHKHLLPDEDDDEFSPFGNDEMQSGNGGQRGSPATKLLATAKAFDPTKLGPPVRMGSPAGFSPGNGPQPLGGSYFGGGGGGGEQHDPNYLGEGMTPLDVLQSVFTSLPVGDLEDALYKTGYNFEEAMALLISQNGGTRSGNSGAFTPGREDGPGHHVPNNRPNVFAPGGPASRERNMPPGGGGTRTPGGLKMCRYYLAGECRRSDCRFSHDVDRALCRFWLRGQCAKGDQCEFIHALPSVDPNMLTNAMSRIELSHDGTSRPRTRTDEFPDLHLASNQRGAVFDPSRNRFANAVKRPVQGPGPQYTHIGGQRGGPVIPPSHRPFSSGSGFRRRVDGPMSTGPPMPHPSPRIKLRPPTLMPTLPTGAAMNDMYMEARQAAIKLGQSRNACLARAAEAWRRGDGATAKRFSREANVLNERMTVETADAAANLVRQRRIQAQDAIRARGEWSNDPDDRSSKGKECASGLGVIMGVAGVNILGPGAESLSTSERTEVLLDLHMLHANEASDVLEDFLMALERENFHGLAYIVVGDERHVGTQDTGRGASRHRLAAGIKLFLQRYGYPWSEGGGCICIDPLTHA
ncbi:hypothetical protein HD553DRAFT_273093 [Filobasidium floriforme]|uniref:uncharacterized protein n=1 Tax=Filobasidium floriforme TaxID=5210 RepID=UPI001E8D0635|nr:uncharacterized protein HD553DRAFT_273093 [Filobasidium floriforme]KAH8083689.1 hypothetical protein HD553DRAFT_273093 [Filobasidium floriforme]